MENVNQMNQVAAEANLNNDNNITQVKQVAAEADLPVNKAAEAKACLMPKGYENWKLFPCSFDKRPQFPGWKDLATSDAGQLRIWSNEFSGCMWGALTGEANGFFVVDLDCGHAEGVDGMKSFKKYCDEHGYEIPETLVAQTAGGGLHFYFKMPEGRDIRNAAGILPGVDVRGNGGFIIVPPSVNQDTGKSYKWFNPSQPIMDAPDWLLDLVTKKKKEKPDPPEAPAEISEPIEGGGTAYGNTALAKEVEEMRKAVEGTRNDTLNRVAFNLYGLVKGGELEKDVVDQELEAAALETGLSKDEILRTMDSAWNGAKARTAPDRVKILGEEDAYPIPLRRPPQQQQPYPTNAFFDFADTVADVAQYTNTPQSMVGSGMLAALSFMSMPLANVKTPKFGGTPLSLFMLPVGETGDGKTTVENILFKRISEREKDLMLGYESQCEDFEAEEEIFNTRKKCLKDQLRSGGIDEGLYRTELGKLTKPKKPAEPHLLTSDVNVEGLYKYLLHGLPYIGLITDEGGRLFGGTAFSKENELKTISNLSSLWSGRSLDKMRQGEGASKIYDRRVCASIMLQPNLAKKLLSNELFTEQGFLCRFLISWPLPRKRTANQVEIESLPSVQLFYNACEQLLNLPFRWNEKSGGLAFDELTLCPEAMDSYQDYFEEIEKNRQPNEKYEQVNGHAKRAAEQALRIGGCLSMVRNPTLRVIDKETMEAGIMLADWYLNEILRITLDSLASPEILQAEQLLQWFKEKSITVTSERQVLQFGPNALRESSKVKAVFKTLIDHQWLVPISGEVDVWMGDGKQSRSRKAFMVQDEKAA